MRSSCAGHRLCPSNFTADRTLFFNYPGFRLLVRRNAPPLRSRCRPTSATVHLLKPLISLFVWKTPVSYLRDLVFVRHLSFSWSTQMSNIVDHAKQAAAALTAVVALNVATATPALAWGHTPGDKARNAAVVVGALAIGIAAVRRARRSSPANAKKSTLG